MDEEVVKSLATEDLQRIIDRRLMPCACGAMKRADVTRIDEIRTSVQRPGPLDDWLATVQARCATRCNRCGHVQQLGKSLSLKHSYKDEPDDEEFMAEVKKLKGEADDAGRTVG